MRRTTGITEPHFAVSKADVLVLPNRLEVVRADCAIRIDDVAKAVFFGKITSRKQFAKFRFGSFGHICWVIHQHFLP
jgi:hypothetical protein